MGDDDIWISSTQAIIAETTPPSQIVFGDRVATGPTKESEPQGHRQIAESAWRVRARATHLHSSADRPVSQTVDRRGEKISISNRTVSSRCDRTDERLFPCSGWPGSRPEGKPSGSVHR